MASVLDRYGIKEVADVTFYKLDDNGVPTYPVLFLDTLKVSTIEQTAETTDARGGKGNAKLISWDYNKEINVTLEDALFSAKSLAIMFGDGNVRDYKFGSGAYADASVSASTPGLIMKTEMFTTVASSSAITLSDILGGQKGWSTTFVGPDGKTYQKKNAKFYDVNLKGGRDDISETKTFTGSTTYFCTYDIMVNASVVEVSANTFPGTYYITGDTFARNEKSGRDEFFQFIIPKAKVTSENTITLEAEGDPSVFNMNLTVLRPTDGVMMKLVKYDLVNGTNTTGTDDVSIYHNHSLDTTGTAATQVTSGS